MKIKPDDYGKMLDAVRSVHASNALDAYRSAGLTDKRYLWDALRVSGYDVCGLYTYLNDTHIDTALRSILRELTDA